MRIVPLLLIVAALGGCASVRKGLGEYQKAADKGIGFNVAPDGPAAPPAASRDELPGGLVGDKAHAAYTSPPQR